MSTDHIEITRLRAENAKLLAIAQQDNRYLIAVTAERDRLLAEVARLSAKGLDDWSWPRGEGIR